MVAFLNDSKDYMSLPPIIKLNNEDFQEAKAWFCLDMAAVMNANHTTAEVLSILDDNTMVITTKIIPIRLFLVHFC